MDGRREPAFFDNQVGVGASRAIFASALKAAGIDQEQRAEPPLFGLMGMAIDNAVGRGKEMDEAICKIIA